MAMMRPSITTDWVLWRNRPYVGIPERYNGDGKYRSFPLLPGTSPFGSLTSGANGSDVWGINSGKVYRLKAKPAESVPMDKISAAADGTVWGIRNKVPHRLANGQWQAMPGSMLWISCGSALEVWALDESWSTGGRPYRWSGTGWVQRGDLHLLSISVSSNGQVVVGTTHQGRVVRWTPGTMETWTEISSTPFLQIVSANNNVMYGSSLGNVYQWNGHSWKYEFGANQGGWVSVADDGTVVVTDARRQVWRSSGLTGWVRLPIPPAISACAAHGNSVWTWNQDQVGSHYWPGEDWELVASPPNMYTISAGVDGTVCGVDSARNIHRYKASDGTWEQMPGTVRQGYLSVGSAEHIIRLAAHVVSRWNVTTHDWDTLPPVPLQAGAAAIGGDGTLLGAGPFRTPTGAIIWYVYQYEDATGWTEVPDLRLYWMNICNADIIVGEIDSSTDDNLLWIGRLGAPSMTEVPLRAMTEEVAERVENIDSEESALAAARRFFGEAGVEAML